MMRAQMSVLPDGRRLHLHDGPIDLIVEAFGTAAEIKLAYQAAGRRFTWLLNELCDELSILRQAATSESPDPDGPVAQRMMNAVRPFASEHFITPMAAVAGAVAEEILSAMLNAAELTRAYVNDGGDIAIHLARGHTFVVGMIERPDRPSLFGSAKIESGDPVRGIATSGWRGRSFSLGIADAVTVLADTAAAADAAATLIANAVDLPEHPNIIRVPANQLAPGSDLGGRLVTQHVGDLADSDVNAALEAGTLFAESLVSRGLIHSAALCLQGTTRIAAPTAEGSLAYA